MPITNTFIRLDRKVLTAPSNAVSFTSIDATYTDLYLVASARTDSTSTNSGSAAVDTCYVRFNNNLTNVSSTQYWEGVPNNSPTTAVVGPETVFRALGATTANASANVFANGYMRIPDYRSNTNKIITWDFVGENDAESNSLRWNSGFFNSTAVITQIDIFPIAGNFIAGTTFTLYGIASAGTQNTRPTLKATGGLVSWDDTYVYHTFASSGTFTTTSGTVTCDVVRVAGGGGGGATAYSQAGGGGAGGLLYDAGLSISGSNAITIGAGGAGGIPAGTNGPGAQGSSTSCFSLTAPTGGGGGATNFGGPGGSGGSGGGGGNNNPPNNAGGAGIAGQGFAGATLDLATYFGGGGGGAGGAAPTNVAGVGGVGLTYFGQNLAGGGSGSTGTNANSIWGGGGSIYITTGSGFGPNGAFGTGGGGGTGTGDPGTNVRGGNGGSGVVIVRYLK